MKDGPFYNVPVLQLTAEKLSRKGAYLIDNGQVSGVDMLGDERGWVGCLRSVCLLVWLVGVCVYGCVCVCVCMRMHA